MIKSSQNIVSFVFILTVLASSCSTVKHLPEGELLYSGTRDIRYNKTGEKDKDWKINDYAEKSKDVVMSIWAVPNGALLGMPYMSILPIRLYYYNWFYTEKEKGFKHWMMNNFGEPPVTISAVNPAMKVKSLENELFNMGHFGVKGHYQLKYKGKKRAVLLYSIDLPKAYTYRNISVKLDSLQDFLRIPIDSYMKKSILATGDDFNLKNLELEKDLLWEHLQNNGYFYIKKNHLIILADTTVGNKQVDLQFRIDKDLSANYYTKKHTSEKIIWIDDRRINLSDNKTISGKDIRIDKRLLDGIIEISDDSLYSLDKTKKTIRNISSTGIFAEPIIKYMDAENDSSGLVARIDLKTTDMFNVSLNSNITQKSSGFIGPGIGASATQLNLFGGAENLTIKIDGYFDFPYGPYSKNVSRSYGFSSMVSLTTPMLKRRIPLLAKNSVVLPIRRTSIGVEMNNRPDYFNIVEWKGIHGIEWTKSSKISHQLNLVNINYSNILSTTPDFDTLYSESAQLRNSIKDQFILGTSYTFTYNNTAGEFKRIKTYFRTDIELSGNLLNAVYAISGQSGQNKEFLGVEFSQYVRMVTDFRAYIAVGERGSQIAFRNQIGAGVFYGNSSAMPYIKQFYVGGNNSLRPVSARVLGPGRYFEFDAEAINQVGDFKFESNLEYRFKIAYILYGALWSDFGNIWLWKDDPERPNTGIKFNRLLTDSYLTSGAGLRLDMDFIVIRADYGAILYAPIFVDGYKWLWQHKAHLWGLSLGIGYPF